MGRQITVKELFPGITAVAICGHERAVQQVISNCDNQAVVAVINSQYSLERDLMQMLHCLSSIPAISLAPAMGIKHLCR